jgi:hypothetical protein
MNERVNKSSNSFEFVWLKRSHEIKRELQIMSDEVFEFQDDSDNHKTNRLLNKNVFENQVITKRIVKYVIVKRIKQIHINIQS